MIRQNPGGQSPFAIEPRPNLVQKTTYQEVIDRDGEAVIFLRKFTAPNVETGRLASPDDMVDSRKRPFSLRFQKSVRLDTESIGMQYRQANRFFTNYKPIRRVRRMWINRGALQGGLQELKVKSFDDVSVTIESDTVLKYYEQVYIDYDVKMFSKENVITEMKSDGRSLDLSNGQGRIYNVKNRLANVCVNVYEIWVEEGDKWRQMGTEEYSRDFTKINFLLRAYERGRKFRVIYDQYDAIRISYRTFSLKDLQNEHAARLGLMAGDLEAVIGAWYLISEGDSFIFTNVFNTAKENAKFDTEKQGYGVANVPVREIDSVFYLKDGIPTEIDPDECTVKDFRYIILPESAGNPKNIQVVYSYHPSYVAKKEVEFSALADKQQPRKWILSPSQHSVVLP